MNDFLKTLVGLLDANSKLDRVALLVKEATLVVVAALAIAQGAIAVLQAVETVLNAFTAAAK